MKKKAKGNNRPVSPEIYIRQRARELPIDKCYINSQWQAGGLANISVVRAHPKGTFTAGLFLVDMYCRGVCDSYYLFNVDRGELNDFIERSYSNCAGYEEVEYNVVHNIIYGAIEFAGEIDIMPCKEFGTTKYLIEEDDDKIEFIQYEYGKDGKYCLSVPYLSEANKYLPKLKKNLGDDFLFECGDLEEDDLFMGGFDKMMRRNGLTDRFSYEYPEYPKELSVKHKIVGDFLSDPDKNTFSADEISLLLSLPALELKEDLENIILYVTGLTAHGEELPDDKYVLAVSHAVMLLAEVGDENSLDVLFEVLRQSQDYMDYHFGDLWAELIIPTLYKIGRNNPRKLFDFMKEPGHEPFFRSCAGEAAIKYIIRYEPERRSEILAYCKELLVFLVENKDNPLYMSGSFAAMIVDSLCFVKAFELQDDIKALFETGNVDENLLGGYKEAVAYLHKGFSDDRLFPLDVYGRYEHLTEIMKSFQ